MRFESYAESEREREQFFTAQADAMLDWITVHHVMSELL
jgi:hypothetical protein